MNYLEMTIGEIVANNFASSEVFSQFGIDFCCGGDRYLQAVIDAKNIDQIALLDALQYQLGSKIQVMNFKAWSLELLVDYVTKYHHVNIREQGPDLLKLCQKVASVHGESQPHLIQVATLFENALEDLLSHLMKEDRILFPAVYQLAAKEPVRDANACFASVEMPISVMMHEHDIEGARFREISQLTNHYDVPEDACQSYRLMMTQLSRFEKDLHEHIHVENNLIFPEAIRREAALHS